MSSEQGLIHVGYGLMLAALLARDMLWLRLLLVAAQSCIGAYAISLELWSMAAWNGLFVLINCVWSARILLERRALRLPPELEALHRNPFAAFSARAFLGFWALGQTERHPAGVRLTRYGDTPPALYLVVDGRVEVRPPNAPAVWLGAGRFVGEMSLITGGPASADVVTLEPVTLRVWTLPQLQRLSREAPLQWTRLLSSIGFDLVHKLRRAVAAESAQPSSPSQAVPS